jgi:glycosyltransferase involved in cell wall biosynthesis
MKIGGVERHVREVTTRLARRGMSVRVICAEPGGPARQELDMDGVPVTVLRSYPSERDYNLVPGLWAEMAREPADVVHVQSYHTFVAPLAMARARSLGLPYLLTFHGGGSSIGLRNRLRSSQRMAQRRLYRNAAKLVGIADFEIRQYVQELRLAREHFVLIPNGTELTLPPAYETASADPLGDGEITLATIGRLERYKGHQRVIAAMPALLRRRPGARLLVVGTGPYEEDLRQAAVRTGVAERIRFTSVTPGDALGMGRLLGSLDAVVLMSEFETHPLVALEAAAARRRMVVANVGGLGELAEKGFGRAVPLSLEPEALAAVIDEQLAAPAPTVVPELFSWEDCAQALGQLYRETVLRPAPETPSGSDRA